MQRNTPCIFDLLTLLRHPSRSRVVDQQLVVTSVGRRLHVRPRGQFKEWLDFCILVRVSLVPIDR